MEESPEQSSLIIDIKNKISDGAEKTNSFIKEKVNSVVKPKLSDANRLFKEEATAKAREIYKSLQKHSQL